MSIQNTTLLGPVSLGPLLFNTIFTSTPGFKSISSSGASAVTAVYLCNTGAVTLPVDLHVVPFGATADGTNIVYSSIQIAPHDTYVLDTERLILDNGDFLAATTTADASIISTVIFVGI